MGKDGQGPSLVAFYQNCSETVCPSEPTRSSAGWHLPGPWQEGVEREEKGRKAGLRGIVGRLGEAERKLRKETRGGRVGGAQELPHTQKEKQA